MDLFIKLSMLAVFFGTMIGIGLYCRKHATDVNGFVLGGRSVGPWLTAFAYVPLISARLYLLDTPVSLAGSTASRPHGQALATPFWVRFWRGRYLAAAPG